ncbi:MAG: cysteine desulfurase-like protein [Planctomycetota bacterium]|nr:cysteine desulfurase-like protein [Planctomycetota bacterium]
MSADFEFQEARSLFPALNQKVGEQVAIYADGPGGTQVPRAVIEAISEALELGISNLGGNFVTSVRADSVVLGARQAVADFLGASRPEEIVFGQNMTSLNFALSRSLARNWSEGDEIVLSRIDHDANISPWLKAAEDKGVTVRWLPFGKDSGELDIAAMPGLLNERTKLVAVTYASNALGSISPLRQIIDAAHGVGALCIVDAVHFGPHGLIDVKELDCDALLCSAYKFFGPHIGIMYGKHSLLSEWTPYKLRPAYDKPPERWETGTQSIEALHGVTAAIDYIASLSQLHQSSARRQRIVAAMSRIQRYETELSQRFLDAAEAIEGVKVYGVTDRNGLDRRTPTFALSIAGVAPGKVADLLGELGIFVWSGHYYAMTVMEDLELDESGGLVRIGFVHYNSPGELDRIIAALAAIAGSQS